MKTKNEEIKKEYDFVVIGGGPSGSVFSTLVAKEGHDVLILEGSKFPRFAVGEIIAPTAMWRMWNRLGISKEMLDKKFVKKWGAGWISPNGTLFNFHQDVFPEDPVCHAHVYQLDRSVYDHFLLNNARENDVTALEEARVEELLYNDEGRMNGVTFLKDGKKHEVRCKLVVDASGRANFIPRKLDIRMEREKLNSFACFAHWEGCLRDKGKHAGDVRLLFTENNLWYWWAPLKSPKASIGIVADVDTHYEEYSKDPEAFYDKWVTNHPYLKRRIEGAKRITDFEGVKNKMKKNNGATLTNFHAKSTETAGDGWVLAGDSLGFVDPVFSLGLHLAQSGSEILADAVIKGMKEDDLSKDFLYKEYHDKYQEEFGAIQGHIYHWATYYFDPRVVDIFLKWGNKYSRIRDIYIRTFIAFEKKAIKEFSALFEKMLSAKYLADQRETPDLAEEKSIEEEVTLMS